MSKRMTPNLRQNGHPHTTQCTTRVQHAEQGEGVFQRLVFRDAILVVVVFFRDREGVVQVSCLPQVGCVCDCC